MSAIMDTTLPNLAIELAAKSLLLLSVVLSLTWFMRRSSAAVRHYCFAITAIVLIVLPLTSMLVPSWRPGLFPKRFDSLFIAADTPIARFGAGSEISTDIRSEESSTGVLSIGDQPKRTWRYWFLTIWISGSTLLLLGLIGGKAYGFTTVQHARPVEDEEFLQTLHEVSDKAGLKRQIIAFESARFRVPSVMGIFHPKLLIPPQAVFWPRDRLTAVLQHEISHIKRNDILMQLIAQIACCVYWLNPLAWIMERKLFIERERACDDIALSQDVKASEYAGHLMEVLEEMGNMRNTLWVTAAMAEGTDFKDRILSVLNPAARRNSPRKGHMVAVTAAVFFLLLPLSALRPWTPEAAVPTRERPVATIADQESGQNSRSSDVANRNDKIRDRDDPTRDKIQVSMLIEQLKNPSARLRGRAAWALGTSGDRKAVLPLIEVLDDENVSVREHVASALGSLGDKRAVPKLCDVLLNDENPIVREHAASALGSIGDDRAYHPLLKAIESDPDGGVRAHAINALQRIK